MTIQVGDKLPEAKFRVMTAEGPQVKTTDDIFKGKKVALFAVPAAQARTAVPRLTALRCVPASTAACQRFTENANALCINSCRVEK